MRKFLCTGLFLFFILTATACAKKPEKVMLDETMRIIDDQMNSAIVTYESAPYGELPWGEINEGEENTPEPPVKMVDLKLPLVVKNKTAYRNDMYALRINEEGILESSESNHLYYGHETWNQIDTDVRSIEYSENGTTLYIKNDNALWGFGSNKNGRLGDGTGVDKTEPVKILDDVARVIYDDNMLTSQGNKIYAIKTDKSLWVWGDGENYAPVWTADNIVDIQFYNKYMSKTKELLHESTGNIYQDGVLVEHPYSVYNFSGSLNDWLDKDKKLWIDGIEIADEVSSYKLFNIGYYNDVRLVYFIIKEDNTLWGFGNNNTGALGDGTKVPRDKEVIKIADDVAEAGVYWYLKNNGEYWSWNIENPTPTKILDNVVAVQYPDFSVAIEPPNIITLKDGRCIFNLEHWLNGYSPLNNGAINDPAFVFEVKLPETHVFD